MPTQRKTQTDLERQAERISDAIDRTVTVNADATGKRYDVDASHGRTHLSPRLPTTALHLWGRAFLTGVREANR